MCKNPGISHSEFKYFLTHTFPGHQKSNNIRFIPDVQPVNSVVSFCHMQLKGSLIELRFSFKNQA